MPIRYFDDWATARSQSLPLTVLSNSAIGIDASFYLDLHLNRYGSKEPLLPALGGFPFSLKANIERELRVLHDNGVSPVFVFKGLETECERQEVQRLETPVESARAIEHAWELYAKGDAVQVVEVFSSAGNTKPEHLYKFLQRILEAEGIEYLAAPYAATPQLAYLLNGPKQFIDAIFGPTDAFLFQKIDKLITRLDILNADTPTFTWVTKQACQDELGRLSDEQFLDFALLLGTPFSRTFPVFEAISAAQPNGANGVTPPPASTKPEMVIREALAMFNAAGRSALALCAQYEEHPRVQETEYADLYKRAYTTVRHHVILDIEGGVAPLDQGNHGADLHELIGQRLPEELYYYISKGVLDTRVPNWLTTGEMSLELPLGVEDSEAYRTLVVKTLLPARTAAVRLLANNMHRFFQTKTVTARPWFVQKGGKVEINLKNLPSLRDVTVPWKVRGEDLPETLRDVDGIKGCLFGPALRALQDESFVEKTFAQKNSEPLSTKSEILANVTWRFLTLQGYIDEQHHLTSWGKALLSALPSPSTPTNASLEEQIFLAVELLRLKILNAEDVLPGSPAGASMTHDDKKFTALISRAATVGKIAHQPIGYSGPLNRQVLDFRSQISAVRVAQRDLLEIVLVNVLLNGEAKRERTDWAELSLGMPFIDDNDCGLGLAVRTYLETLHLEDYKDPTSERVREDVKAKGQSWFHYIDSFKGNLATGFGIWEAVYRAAKTAEAEGVLEEGVVKVWDEAQKWLQARR